jgi:hypothetical protein
MALASLPENQELAGRGNFPSLDSAKSLGSGRERVTVMVLWETAKAEIM